MPHEYPRGESVDIQAGMQELLHEDEALNHLLLRKKLQDVAIKFKVNQAISRLDL